jgi:HAD superfamily hydrolase (TIGR01490 family)
VSVFDLDHTLITSNCSLEFCRYLISKDVVPSAILLHSALYYFRHVFFNMPPEALHRRVFERFLKGRDLESLERHVDGFIRHYLPKALYFPALAQLRLAQHLGHFTMILSNSPSFLVKKMAAALDVSHWKATEYVVDKERKLCHISSIMQGEEKASYVLKIAKKLGIDRMSITAYSDSIWDLPLLLAAGTAIAVHPDRKLRAYSRKLSWDTL